MLDKLTFYGLYEEWMEYKKTCTNSSNTILRHKQHYRKYLENFVLRETGIKRINELLIEKEYSCTIKEFKLFRKEWANLKTILLGMFTYAYKKKYLTENLMENVKITVKFCWIQKKTRQTRNQE